MRTSPVFTLAESYDYAVRITRQSGSSFRLSFLMLPRRDYQAMCVLYAFMRLTDDLADAPLVSLEPIDLPTADAEPRPAMLERWREQLLACLTRGEDTHPLHPALRDVVTNYAINPEWLYDVITGVEFDLAPQQLTTFNDLQRYCYLVAGTVGLCCQAIWRADLSQTHDLAVQCGEAFQLTNILRDIREDAERGRCYLALEDLQAAGLTETQLHGRDLPEGFVPLIEQHIQRARDGYDRARELEQHLRGAGKRMFRIMFKTYSCLLSEIERDPQACFYRRIRISGRRRVAILLTAPHRRLFRAAPTVSR